MPHRKIKIGDHVLAYNPDMLPNSKELIEGVVTGVQLMLIAVDFGRRESDIWPYDITEITKISK